MKNTSLWVSLFRERGRHRDCVTFVCGLFRLAAAVLEACYLFFFYIFLAMYIFSPTVRACFLHVFPLKVTVICLEKGYTVCVFILVCDLKRSVWRNARLLLWHPSLFLFTCLCLSICLSFSFSLCPPSLTPSNVCHFFSLSSSILLLFLVSLLASSFSHSHPFYLALEFLCLSVPRTLFVHYHQTERKHATAGARVVEWLEGGKIMGRDSIWWFVSWV